MTSAEEWLRIESLDLEAQGVAHNGEGKVVFVEDALPGEEVRVATKRRKNNWEQATLVELRRESSLRVVPRCPHFGVCGGCKMQHLDVAAQVATKQRALEDALWHLGKVRPERVLRPMRGPDWNYRQRARLSVRHVAKKGTVLVGFHERKSSFVAEIRSCDVLPRHVSDLIMPLRALVAAMPAIRVSAPVMKVSSDSAGARRPMTAAAAGPCSASSAWSGIGSMRQRDAIVARRCAMSAALQPALTTRKR